MQEDRRDAAEADEDGRRGDEGNERLNDPTGNRRGWWRSNNAIESRGKRRIF